jgi:hypothetical protein
MLSVKGDTMQRIIVIVGWLASLGLLLSACGAGSPIAPTATIAPALVQTAPQHGDKAPNFTLADSNGNRLQLATVVAEHKSTVLVFYLSHT